MIEKPIKCWRNRDDCEPLHSIESFPEALSDPEAFFNAMQDGTLEAQSFICCGCIAEGARTIPQDAYRVCWKNDAVDEMGGYDEQDLTHQMAVLSQAVAIIATRRVNGGMIAVPTMQAAPQAAP